MAATATNLDEIKKFQCPSDRELPGDYFGQWNLCQSLFLAWDTEDQSKKRKVCWPHLYLVSIFIHSGLFQFHHLDFSIPQHPQGSTPFACSLRCEMFLTDIFQIYCLHSEFSFLRINLDCSPRTQKLKYISFWNGKVNSFRNREIDSSWTISELTGTRVFNWTIVELSAKMIW